MSRGSIFADYGSFGEKAQQMLQSLAYALVVEAC